jgi:hypothetical protein
MTIRVLARKIRREYWLPTSSFLICKGLFIRYMAGFVYEHHIVYKQARTGLEF